MQLFGIETDNQLVTLSRYARIVGYTEWAFFGISHPDSTRFALRKIWNIAQREDIANYLSQAQYMIEEVVEFPLKPRWITNEFHPFSLSLFSKWAKILECGIRADEEISSGAVVDKSTDPCTVTIVGVSSILDVSEVEVYHPGTKSVIDFSSAVVEVSPVSLGAGVYQLVISIPKPRLVAEDKWDNPESGWVYTDPDVYESTVDVFRVYNDPSIQASLIYKDCSNCDTSFSSSLTEGRDMFIVNPEIGSLIVDPSADPSCSNKTFVSLRINYRAGMTEFNRHLESMVIRLAHSLMAAEPCSEPIIMRLWQRDRDIPKILTRDRIDCPFGMSDGAWTAWKWACGAQVVRASSLIGRMK